MIDIRVKIAEELCERLGVPATPVVIRTIVNVLEAKVLSLWAIKREALLLEVITLANDAALYRDDDSLDELEEGVQRLILFSKGELL